MTTNGMATDSVADVRDPTSPDNPEIPDRTLVERVLAGEGAAFEFLVRRHQGALFRRARWMGLDADTAADMVQDALLKAYESLASCRNPDRFRFWVGQILRNKCLDFLKSAARRSVPLPLSLSADRGDPEREEERNAMRGKLKAALATLPEGQREAFLMKHAEELSYEEMTELTGTSVSALKMRVHRARETLQAHLVEFASLPEV